MSIEQRLREAALDAHRAAREVASERILWKTKARPRFAIAVAAFLVVIAIAAPLVLLRGAPGSGPSVILSGESFDTSEIPNEVVDYWSKEGTLESVGAESGWLCPVRPTVGYTSEVDPSAIPGELSMALAGSTPVESFFHDDGPLCSQPPSLVMLEFSDDTRTEATAGLTVWPSLARFEDTCPLGDCGAGDNEEGVFVDEVSINDDGATLSVNRDSFQLWWVDPNGVPLYAKGSGIPRAELLALAESFEADATTHTVQTTLDGTDGLEIVEQGPSIGVWLQGYSKTDIYEIDGLTISVRSRFDRGLTPLTRYSGGVAVLQLTEVNDSAAVWIPEGGNHLEFELGDVIVDIQGAANLDQAIALAEDLQP